MPVGAQRDMIGNNNQTEDALKRLSHLETSNAQIVERFEGLRNKVDTLQVSIERLISDIQHGASTNWGTLASWAAVVITLCGSFLYPLYDKISQANENAAKLAAEADVRLRGEMRTLDSALQNEMETMGASIIGRVDVNKMVAERNQDEVAKHEDAISGLEKVVAVLSSESRRWDHEIEWLRTQMKDLQERAAAAETNERWIRDSVILSRPGGVP
jgi:predicted nuclease with TOPRIM domain